MISELVLFDYVLVAVLFFSTVVSLFRGFFKEAMSLGTWVIAIWLAWKFGPQVADGLTEWITPSAIRLWAARALIVVTVLIAGGLLGAFLHFVLETTGLTGTDRAIGMVFGFTRGIVLASLLVLVLEAAGFDETEWWPNSQLIPYTEPVTDMIRHAAEDGFEMFDDIEEADMLPDAPPAAGDEP